MASDRERATAMGSFVVGGETHDLKDSTQPSAGQPRVSPLHQTFPQAYAPNRPYHTSYDLSLNTWLAPTSRQEIRSPKNTYSVTKPLGIAVPGTESPYRVESPSGNAMASASASNILSLQQSMAGFMENSTFEDNPYKLHAYAENASRKDESQRAERPSAGGDTAYPAEMVPSSVVQQRMQNQPAARSTQTHLGTATGIKNFLAVNKWSNHSSGMHSTKRSDRLIPFTRHMLPVTPINNYNDSTYRNSLQQPVTELSSSSTTRASSPLPAPQAIRPRPSLNSITNDDINYLSSDSMPSKRKSNCSGNNRAVKMPRTSIGAKRTIKDKMRRADGSTELPAREELSDDIWMRILELGPIKTVKTMRSVSSRFRDMIDAHESILVNQRVEIYGPDMPGPPEGMSEKAYSHLLGGKGCEEEGCDDRACSAAKWAWHKRWCVKCWEKKIVREDRVIKKYQNDHPRTVIAQMLECLPYCVHDSYMKPHDVSEDQDARPPGGPKVHKYYQTEDIKKIVEQYKALTPAPYVENPEHTASEKAAALAAYQELVSSLDQKRTEFFATKKQENEKLMERVKKIETCIRLRRLEISQPNKLARNCRREFHTKMAREELPHIPIDFIHRGKAYKASCRIYRNGGTARTWKSLKPKLEKEWAEELERRRAAAIEEASTRLATPVGGEFTSHNIGDQIRHPSGLGEKSRYQVMNRVMSQRSISPSTIAQFQNIPPRPLSASRYLLPKPPTPVDVFQAASQLVPGQQNFVQGGHQMARQIESRYSTGQHGEISHVLPRQLNPSSGEYRMPQQQQAFEQTPFVLKTTSQQTGQSSMASQPPTFYRDWRPALEEIIGPQPNFRDIPSNKYQPTRPYSNVFGPSGEYEEFIAAVERRISIYSSVHGAPPQSQARTAIPVSSLLTGSSNQQPSL